MVLLRDGGVDLLYEDRQIPRLRFIIRHFHHNSQQCATISIASCVASLTMLLVAYALKYASLSPGVIGSKHKGKSIAP